MKYLLTVLTCLMLIACGENKSKKTSVSTDDYLHVIDLNKAKVSNIRASELFTGITPIVLETTKESLFGAVNKAVITSDYIIILDIAIANALFLFRKDGTFVHKFGRVGGGPGEYVNIWDFCYDGTTETIYTLDTQQRRISLYNIHTGEFLKSINLNRINGLSSNIYCQAGELYIDLKHSTSNEKHILNRINQSTGEIEESWFDLETYNQNIDYIGKSFLFGDGSSLKFSSFLMSSIMLFEKGKITPFLTFAPEYTLEKKDLKNIDFSGDYFELVNKLSRTRKVHNISDYFEHKDLIFLKFGLDPRMIVYNQKTKEAITRGLLNDFFYAEDFLRAKNNETDPIFIAKDDKGFYDLRLLKKEDLNENLHQ